VVDLVVAEAADDSTDVVVAEAGETVMVDVVVVIVVMEAVTTGRVVTIVEDVTTGTTEMTDEEVVVSGAVEAVVVGTMAMTAETKVDMEVAEIATVVEAAVAVEDARVAVGVKITTEMTDSQIIGATKVVDMAPVVDTVAGTSSNQEILDPSPATKIRTGTSKDNGVKRASGVNKGSGANSSKVQVHGTKVTGISGQAMDSKLLHQLLQRARQQHMTRTHTIRANSTTSNTGQILRITASGTTTSSNSKQLVNQALQLVSKLRSELYRYGLVHVTFVRDSE